MPTLDEITLEEEAARHRLASRAATVRPRWCEACRDSHYWCAACESLNCQHVFEVVTAEPPP